MFFKKQIYSRGSAQSSLIYTENINQNMLSKLFYKLKYVTKPRKCSYASIPELYHCNEEIKSVN